MRRAALAVAAGLLASLPAGAQVVPPASAPVVVELFTAQGCKVCPPANAWVGRLAERADVLVLTWPVDYWDYLGWKDTLAQPAFAARQRGYRTKLGLRDVYTPQVIVNGRAEAPGHKAARVQQVMSRFSAHPAPAVTIERGGARVFVGGGATPDGGADAWMIRYDPRILNVKVGAGETAGQTVSQRNTVREVRRLGPWTGRPRSYDLPPRGSRVLKTAVLIQGPREGIIAAGRD